MKFNQHNNNTKINLWTRLLSFCLIMLTAGAANAVSLGELEVRSRLNAPLHAVIPLQASDAELQQLEVALGSARAFERAGIEQDKLLHSLQFKVVREDTASYILVTSTQLVREPLLEFVMSVRWANGRMLREVAVFLAP